MILDKIINGCGTLKVDGNTAIDITGVCNDSRKVVSGSLFVAISGFASDGHDYICAVLEKGAAAIVYENEE